MCVQTFDDECLWFRCVFPSPVVVPPRPSTGSPSHVSINQVLLYLFISPDKTIEFFPLFDKEKKESKSAVKPWQMLGLRRSLPSSGWLLGREGGGRRGHWQQHSLRNSQFCFCRMPDFSSVFANVNICESRCWVGADGGPPGGLEEPLFTCPEECRPAPTLLYLSGGQGHRGGRDGPRFVPFQSFHLAVSTTQHNVGELRGGTGILAHVGATTTTKKSPSTANTSPPTPHPPLRLWYGKCWGERWDHFCGFNWMDAV